MSNLLMSNVYRVAFVQEQGFGWFTPEDWAATPSWARGRVHVLATVETEEEAKRAFATLPQQWKDVDLVDLHYQDGEWWQSTDMCVTNSQGQEVELFVPLGHPQPWTPVATEKLLPPPDWPKLLTD